MTIRNWKALFGNAVSVLAITSFLIVSQGAVTNAFSAEWETWPRKGKEGAAAEGAEKAGEGAGKAVSSGVSAGTIGKVALIGAGLVAIGLIAAGGGGGSSSSTAPPTCQQ